MGLAVGGRKAGAVVLHDDLAAGLCFPGSYGDVKGSGLRIHAVFDGVLHDGLEGQRRQAKLLALTDGAQIEGSRQRV